jgi:hypothetical protein
MANLNTKIKTWGTNRKKSGAVGLGLVLAAMDQMDQENPNGSPFLEIAHKNSTWEALAKSNARLICGQVWGSVTLKQDKKKSHGMRVVYGDNNAPTKHYQALRDMVEQGVSITDTKAIKEAFGIESVAPEFDLEKYVTNVAKRLIKTETGEDRFTTLVKSKVSELKAAS